MAHDYQVLWIGNYNESVFNLVVLTEINAKKFSIFGCA